MLVLIYILVFFFFKQKTAYEMRISDWSSDVCSSDLLLEDLHVTGAVHRLHSQDALLGLGDEHVLVELLPVSRGLPQRAVDELRCPHLDVAGGLQAAAQVGLHRAVARPALRVPEHRSGGLLLQVEEVHLPPEAPVIALLGLLQHGEVGLQPLLVLPAGAVDALELGIARVAAPVGTGDLGQLEGMAELARRGQMRADAEVETVALAVDGELLAGRQSPYMPGLILLADGRAVAERQ